MSPTFPLPGGSLQTPVHALPGKLGLVAIDFCNFFISAAVTRTSSGHIQNWWEKPHHSEIMAFELIVITEWNFEFSLLGKEGVCSIR